MKLRFACGGGSLLALVLAILPSPSIGQQLQLLSTIDPQLGPAAGGGGDSWAPIITPDARYVLFASTANNLVLATNGSAIPLNIPAAINVYLRDRTNGITSLVSINLSGVAGGNANSWPVAISTNGQFALFESSASDLVADDTNNASDIFVRDLVNGTTLLVSASTNGGVGNGTSRSAAMTPDGRYVAFVSAANNLVPNDTNGIADVFLRDMLAGTTTLLSAGAVSTNAALPSGSSEAPDITPDGRYVAFYSTATNLVSGVPPGGDIYVRDVIGASTIWASSYARTAVPSNSVFSFNHAISADGQYVAYEASAALNTFGSILRYNTGSGATDVIHQNAAVPTGTYEDMRSLDLSPDGRFVAFIANTNGTSGSTTCAESWDGQSRNLALVSGDPTGQIQPYSACDWPVVDPSGRYVAFLSSATNLSSAPRVGDYHLYLHDAVAGTTTLVDAGTNGTGSPVSAASVPRFSADFRFLAFECADASLVPGDRNRSYDVFVRDLVAGTNDLVSVHGPGLASLSPNGPSSLATASISSNGQYIAFASEAENLVPNDTNNCRDIFVRDLVNGTTLLVSAATNGYSGDGVSSDPTISPDGRYVAFSSRADNLVPADNNNRSDVFVRDLQNGATSLVSINTNGTGPGNYDSYAVAVSAGGRFVLFRSTAYNLAPGTSGENLFLRDQQMAVTYALTTNWNFYGQGGELVAAMTPDGRYVAYEASPALNTYLLQVWDTSIAKPFYTISGSSYLYSVAISAQGNRIAFSWTASGGSYGISAADIAARTNWTVLTAGGYFERLRLSGDGHYLTCFKAPISGTAAYQVSLYDLQAGTNVLVSHTYYDPATGGNGNSDLSELSADGRFVVYRSAATNIVAGDTNSVSDVFLYDRLSGANTVLSTNRSGYWNAGNRSLGPVFSGDAQSVFFESWASGLVSDDFSQTADLFGTLLYPRITIPPSPSAFGPGKFNWTFNPGWNYRVQYKDSLDDPTWHDLSSPIILMGGQASFQDPTAPPSQRFYRVVAY